MTPEEAIEIITNAIQTDNMTAEQDKALAIVQKATEKQIAKKVKKIKFTNGTINYGCPICKRKIISKVDGEFCGGAIDDYCNRCGQALDWSDENVSKRSN